jgi:hypothetical protein
LAGLESAQMFPLMDYGPEPNRQVSPDATNPKDLLGDNKVDFSQISPFAMAHEACAMMEGTWKYGFRNWRDKKVRALVYTAAALRHIKRWEEGEDLDDESLAHHLGHARACLGIVIDAQETGNLVDDRVKSKGELGQLMNRLGDWVVNRRRHQGARPVMKKAQSPSDFGVHI